MAQSRQSTQARVHGVPNGSANGHLDGTIKPEKGAEARTNLSWWRLNDVEGRQTWEYLEDEDKRQKRPQSVAEKWHLGLPTVSCNESTRLGPSSRVGPHAKMQ